MLFPKVAPSQRHGESGDNNVRRRVVNQRTGVERKKRKKKERNSSLAHARAKISLIGTFLVFGESSSVLGFARETPD